MLLPQKYKWISSIGTLPKLVSIGLSFLGIQEIPGFGYNPIIKGWARDLGLDDIYKNDDTSWCALAMCYWCKLAGKPLPSTNGDEYNMLRAKWFMEFGNHVSMGDERLGDIVIFKRDGGGHVGIIIAESMNTYHVLGGNQSNAVTIAEIAKVRKVGVRRYYSIGMPASAKKYLLSSTGVLSTNEA